MHKVNIKIKKFFLKKVLTFPEKVSIIDSELDTTNL